MTRSSEPGKGRRRRFIWRLAIYGSLIILGWWMFPNLVRMMVYPAPRVALPPSAPDPLRTLHLERRDGRRLVAWYQPAPNAPETAPLVIYFHGNAENLATLWASGLFSDWRRLGVGVLAVEYPGYGSEGLASEKDLVEAGAVAVAWAAENVPRAPLVVVGWSLGAAVAAETAAQENPHIRALILLSAWSSLPEVAAAHYPRWLVGMLIKERYDSVAAASHIRVPALVMHGARDGIIPAVQGERVAQGLENAVWIPVPGYGHNDLLMAYSVWEEIGAFLERNFP